MDNERSAEELKEDLENRIKYYEGQLAITLDQVQRGLIAAKIGKAKSDIKELTAKKPCPTQIKTRIEDPVVGDKKSKSPYDGRGSVINTGSGSYSFMI